MFYIKTAENWCFFYVEIFKILIVVDDKKQKSNDK